MALITCLLIFKALFGSEKPSSKPSTTGLKSTTA
jgi:hypothetical protein